jgi:DNA-binding transcriptional LysR family regulator
LRGAIASPELERLLFILEKLWHGPAMNWDDLHLFLRVARSASMSAASGPLKLSVATIARRLEAFERQLGVTLAKRTPRGLILTAAGEALRQKAEACQAQMAEIERFAASLGKGEAEPFLRLSATEPVIAEIFAPRLAHLAAGGTPIRVELRVENAQISLALNDADIAIRLARPTGDSLMAKRLKPLAMGLFGQRDYLAGIATREGPDLRRASFISYDDSYGRIAELRWIEEQGFATQVRIRTSSTRGMVNAVAAGAGLAILPKVFALRHADLVEIRHAGHPPVPDRHVWIVWHRSLGRRPVIRRVIGWIEACFREASHPSFPSTGNVSSSQ